MIHLRSFNESAGQLYREVDDEEFESHMDSQQVDTFSKGELQILFDNILWVPTKAIEVWLYKVRGTKMSAITFYHALTTIGFTNRAKARVLKTYKIDNKSTRTLPQVGSYPMTPANKIYMWVEGLSWQIPIEIIITKSCDDYFYAYVTTRRVDYYICDGLAGLKSLLVDLFESRKE